MFDEYTDAELYEALRRVHLIPSEDSEQSPDEVNANVFRDLDSVVSEGGENFSTGCVAFSLSHRVAWFCLLGGIIVKSNCFAWLEPFSSDPRCL